MLGITFVAVLSQTPLFSDILRCRRKPKCPLRTAEISPEFSDDLLTFVSRHRVTPINLFSRHLQQVHPLWAHLPFIPIALSGVNPPLRPRLSLPVGPITRDGALFYPCAYPGRGFRDGLRRRWPSCIYTVNHKKRDILFFTITLANLNRFL